MTGCSFCWLVQNISILRKRRIVWRMELARYRELPVELLLTTYCDSRRWLMEVRKLVAKIDRNRCIEFTSDSVVYLSFVK